MLSGLQLPGNCLPPLKPLETVRNRPSVTALVSKPCALPSSSNALLQGAAPRCRVKRTHLPCPFARCVRHAWPCTLLQSAAPLCRVHRLNATGMLSESQSQLLNVSISH
ncbi:UNVERIFIED_CONTAM: hypothetical protein Sangu_3113800 [Sesamum angustifolium]|uniref:Uncharacterized protein n=1 Tax=Sesamum angustifolium TaxID=2727405 RepID=A0AAW2K8S2_9LAMI